MNHQNCSVKKGILRNFTKFTGNNLRQSLFLNKVAGRPATLLKKRLPQVFSCEFCEISKNAFLQNTSGRLLLKRFKIRKVMKRKNCYVFLKGMFFMYVPTIFLVYQDIIGGCSRQKAFIGIFLNIFLALSHHFFLR